MDNGKPPISDLERDPKLQVARVKYPGGEYKEFDVDRGSEGSDLFRQVTAGMKYSLGERKHFALSFEDPFDGTSYLIKNDSTIATQLNAPEIWRRFQNKDYNEYGLPTRREKSVFPSWHFSFEVILYPKETYTLVDDLARYYMFMQIQEDIMTGRLPATTEIHTRLGALVAQLQFGDAPTEMTEEYRAFMSKSKLVPDSVVDPEVHLKIAEHHTQLRDVTATEAQNMYMNICKNLPLYGLHYFSAKDEEDRDVSVGIGAVGINIYHNGNILKSFPLGEYNWEPRRNQFLICLKNAQRDDQNSKATIDFVDHGHARRLSDCTSRYTSYYKTE